jgi:hypothetical protein
MAQPVTRDLQVGEKRAASFILGSGKQPQTVNCSGLSDVRVLVHEVPERITFENFREVFHLSLWFKDISDLSLECR